jgi:hypothetical protein
MDSPKFVFDARSNSAFGRVGKNWVLCIGAGINTPTLPSWDSLVEALVARIFGPDTVSVYKEIQSAKGWSADSWVQVCLNKVLADGGTPESFRFLLSEIIYQPIFLNRTTAEKNVLVKGFSRVGRLSKKEFFLFAEMLISAFQDTTVFQLANMLCTKAYANKMPSVILNFNADTVLDTLVLVLNKKMLAERKSNFDDPPLILNRISNRVAAQNYFRMFEGRIPLYHVHGCLFPFDSKYAIRAHQVSDLVFEENSYADMAQNAYNWGQTIFLSLCQDRQMVFLGLSLTDSNIRKWLIFSQTHDNDTLINIADVKNFTCRHIWIDRTPPKLDSTILDYLTRHLGVKIATLEDWKFVGPALKNLIGIPNTA